MFALIRLFWNICILKRGPQDVPYSASLFAGILILDMLLGQLMYLAPDVKGVVYPASKIFTYLLTDRIVFIAAIYVILSVHNRTSRSLQTIIALLGVDVIFDLLLMPFLHMVGNVRGHTGISLLFLFGIMLIFAWEMLAYSHIFRHSLDISIFRAGGYALFLFVLYLVTIKLAFPVSA